MRNPLLVEPQRHCHRVFAAADTGNNAPASQGHNCLTGHNGSPQSAACP